MLLLNLPNLVILWAKYLGESFKEMFLKVKKWAVGQG
jgi:hypothetical protein